MLRTLVKGRIAQFLMLGTVVVALTALPAYAGTAWQGGNGCNGHSGRHGQSCGGGQNQSTSQWGPTQGPYPPGQVNGMSWWAAGYTPQQAWAVYSGPGGGSAPGY